jgi:hypothetical protein
MMRRMLALWAIAVFAAALQWALVPPGPEVPWWHAIPGAQAVIGVVGCAAIVLVAKGLDRLGLARPDPEGPGAPTDGVPRR